MFKKKENNANNFIVEQTKEEKKLAKKEAQADQDAKAKKSAKATNKKPNIFVRFGKKCKEIFAELKKVTWPTWGKVVKNTGTVIAVVVVFLLIITLYDFGLAELLKLLQSLGA